MTIPVGVARLLASAALAEGLSLDEYMTQVLTTHAVMLRQREYNAELAHIQKEKVAANYATTWHPKETWRQGGPDRAHRPDETKNPPGLATNHP